MAALLPAAAVAGARGPTVVAVAVIDRVGRKPLLDTPLKGAYVRRDVLRMPGRAAETGVGGGAAECQGEIHKWQTWHKPFAWLFITAKNI